MDPGKNAAGCERGRMLPRPGVTGYAVEPRRLTPMKPQELARKLPDIPRWVEARGMLLSGRCRIIGPPDGCVVKHTFASMIGEPDPVLLGRALQQESGYLELGLQREQVDQVISTLPEWQVIESVLHSLGPRSRDWEEVDTGGVRLLRPEEESHLGALPPTLWRATMDEALDSSHVAARFVGGDPVSYCCVSAETESLWDLAIFTPREHRRRGHAVACCAFLIGHMMQRGREPVWGATKENAPSRGLAERLGFVEVDRIFVAVRRKFLEGAASDTP